MPTARKLYFLHVVTVYANGGHPETVFEGRENGNWGLHMHALQRMLPFLAAASHFQHTKYVYIFLQEMQQLKSRHEKVFNVLQNGHHILRRSDRFRAGLSIDLVKGVANSRKRDG